MNRDKISKKLLEIIDRTEDTTSIETRVRTKPAMKSTMQKVRMIMDREIFEGPGSITSEINDMSTNGKVHSFRTEVVADIDLVGVQRFSNCDAVQMISLIGEDENPEPTHAKIPQDLNGC